MKFSVGEKVKFLNESGGGKVLSVIDSRMVLIETDNGFEMPVLVTDLIKDYRSIENSEKKFTEIFTSPIVKEEEKVASDVSLISAWGNCKEEKGIYLAFEPHDQQWLLTGDIDIYLVNNTSSEVLYSMFFVSEKQLSGIDYGSVSAESKKLLETIQREEIENWVKGFVQVLFHSDKPAKVYLPLHCVVEINPARFYKEGNYRSNTLVQGKAIIVTLGLLTSFQSASFDEKEQKAGQNATALVSGQPKEKPVIDKHRSAMGEAIIDLHIGELIDNIAGLTSHDMFLIQMNYFKKTLESAIKNEYSKVTFIHGIGNGVLKNAIIKEIEEYENIENQMASISKFGVGAIDILIKPKK